MKKRIIPILLIFSMILLSSCTITKYKDLSAYPNLLMGTNNGTENFRILDKNYDGILEAEGDGIKVKMASHDDAGWLVLVFDDGHSRNLLEGPEGDAYTVSFEVKTNTKDTDIRVSHRKTNWEDNQINFGSTILNKTNKWIQVTLTGILTGTTASSQVLYIDLRHNPAGTEVSIRNLKLIKGAI